MYLGWFNNLKSYFWIKIVHLDHFYFFFQYIVHPLLLHNTIICYFARAGISFWKCKSSNKWPTVLMERETQEQFGIYSSNKPLQYSLMKQKTAFLQMCALCCFHLYTMKLNRNLQGIKFTKHSSTSTTSSIRTAITILQVCVCVCERGRKYAWEPNYISCRKIEWSTLKSRLTHSLWAGWKLQCKL